MTDVGFKQNMHYNKNFWMPMWLIYF